jgi:hypothetical protein
VEYIALFGGPGTGVGDEYIAVPVILIAFLRTLTMTGNQAVFRILFDAGRGPPPPKFSLRQLPVIFQTPQLGSKTLTFDIKLFFLLPLCNMLCMFCLNKRPTCHLCSFGSVDVKYH